MLVNQGFILTAEGDAIRAGAKPVPGLGPNSTPGEERVIEGMITKVEPGTKSFFVPENKPEKNEWFWKDVPDMAEWVGGEANGVQPLLVDVIDREYHVAESKWALLISQTERLRPRCSCTTDNLWDAHRILSCVTST